MRKHLFVTLLLACGMPLTGNFAAFAAPEPQTQGQAVTTISGTVLDENNEPVIGASVYQKGVKSNAVTTNFDGNFTIQVPKGATLVVSYVGYKNSELAAANGMTIYLQPTTEMLNELVAIGYGSQKKANLTGAVATVDVARVMDSRPVQDVAKALQGAVPGLTITSANGDVDANPTINIRGVGTLSNQQNAAPLIIVDGVPVDDMSFLNPEDIEDISVLKDASSSAIYGTRAAFGVILITTKEASTKDRVSISYNNNFAWSKATVLPKFLNTVDQINNALQGAGRSGADKDMFGMAYSELLPYAQAWQEQHGGKPYTDNVELHPFESWDNVGDYIVQGDKWIRYADWDIEKTLFHTAPSQKHNVSLEGVSGATNYRVSFGYDSREQLLRYNPGKVKRYMANANISTKIFPWLKAGVRFNFSQRDSDTPSALQFGLNGRRNPYQYMWRWPGFFLNYGWIADEEGNKKQFENTIGNSLGSHMNRTTTSNTRMQAWLDAEIIPGLNLQADFTYVLRNMNSDGCQVPYDLWGTWGNTAFTNYSPFTQTSSYAAQSNYRDNMWTMNVFATYAKTFAQDHNFKVMLGSTAEREEYQYFYVSRTGLVDYSLPNLNLASGDTYNTGDPSHWTRATAGFFGRINYDYKGIYLFELNGRYDGSSRFRADDQWAFFPSGSIGYRFSEENYFKPLKTWWSNGKLRASYGHIGNENIGQYKFLPIVDQIEQNYIYWLNGTSDNAQKISMFDMPTLVSNSLTWERIITTDVGLDLGFLNNSITASFDWFQRTNKDMLGPGMVLPAVLGAPAPTMNNGELRTRGWEISLGWNHSFGDWDVYATATLADSRSKITKWNNPNGDIYTFTPGNINQFTEGLYYGDIWGFETDRYFTVDDFTWDTPDGKYAAGAHQTGYAPGIASQVEMQTNSTFVYGPGDVKFKDLDGNGSINAGKCTMDDHGDIKVIGNAMPRYEYSFRVGGAWKGFDLDLFFQGVGKRNMWTTGSTIIPGSQSCMGTFEGQNSYNHYIYDDKWNIVGYEVDQNNTYPAMYDGAGGDGKWSSTMGRGQFSFYPQTRYLLNMAYLRLKNLTVGYTLPYDITRKAYIQKARIYFSAENLAFLYNGAGKYGLDPEIATSATQTRQGGNGGYADFGRTIPMPQTFSFGIQVTF
ncbi:MAG: TonB-dependent receptor [Bacteroidales bacterium]|nr:TonB-dependent receptor [Bacteroidales bacterium]